MASVNCQLMDELCLDLHLLEARQIFPRGAFACSARRARSLISHYPIMLFRTSIERGHATLPPGGELRSSAWTGGGYPYNFMCPRIIYDEKDRWYVDTTTDTIT